jgi:hypothetical protein
MLQAVTVGNGVREVVFSRLHLAHDCFFNPGVNNRMRQKRQRGIALPREFCLIVTAPRAEFGVAVSRAPVIDFLWSILW